ISLEIGSPAGVLARNHPEVTIPPLVPADGYVWTSIRRETCEVHVDSEAEELIDLFRRHAPDLAPPGLFGFRHVHLPKQRRSADSMVAIRCERRGAANVPPRPGYDPRLLPPS